MPYDVEQLQIANSPDGATLAHAAPPRWRDRLFVTNTVKKKRIPTKKMKLNQNL